MEEHLEKTGKVKKGLSWAAMVLLFILAPVLVGAQAQVSVRLTLQRPEVAVGDSVSAVVSISGSRKLDARPALHGLENFIVTEGGTSSRVEVLNGTMTGGMDYTYFIQAKKAGTYQVGPAEVRVEGKIFTSNVEPLVVTPPTQSGGANKGPLFLSAGLSSKDIYMGEQALYTVKLYHQARVSDVSLHLPELKHLAFKQIERPSEYQGVYNGQPYQVLEIKYAVMPSQEGEYPIGPVEMKMNVLQSRDPSSYGRFFEDPFFGLQTARPATVASGSLLLKVLPLPLEGRPSDFCGLVGTFEMHSRLEPSAVKTGESATVTVTISGEGNMNLIPDLKLPELGQAKVYADQPTLKVEQGVKGLKGSKSMKWALVPEEEGHLEIPPLKVSFFDPVSRQYKVLRTSPRTLLVLPGNKEEMSPSKGAAGETGAGKITKQKEVKEVDQDILPIHTSINDLKVPYLSQPRATSSCLVLVAPFFVYLLALGTVKYKERSRKGLLETKARRAAKVFRNQLRSDGLTASDVIDILRNYLNNRFGLSFGALSPDEAAELVRSRGVGLDASETLRSIIQALENPVYTGKGHEAAEEAIRGRLSALIKEIEKEAR